MLVHFLITEFFLVVAIYLSSTYFIDSYGVVGANMGHFAGYCMYFVIVLFIFGSSLFGLVSEEQKE